MHVQSTTLVLYICREASLFLKINFVGNDKALLAMFTQHSRNGYWKSFSFASSSRIAIPYRIRIENKVIGAQTRYIYALCVYIYLKLHNSWLCMNVQQFSSLWPLCKFLYSTSTQYSNVLIEESVSLQRTRMILVLFSACVLELADLPTFFIHLLETYNATDSIHFYTSLIRLKADRNISTSRDVFSCMQYSTYIFMVYKYI